MLAGIQRGISGRVTILRRHAQRHGLHIRHRFQKRFYGAVGRHAIHGAVAAGGGDQIEIRISGNGWKMLVANDFADADDGELCG